MEIQAFWRAMIPSLSRAISMPSPSSAPSIGRPVLLLLGSGAAFGSVYALAKPVLAAGISPLLLILLQALGGGAIILALAIARGRAPRLSPLFLRYYAIGGSLGFAVPNALLYAVIPHVGVGIGATITSLSPLFTWGMARLIGMEPHSARRALGLATGFAGAALLAARGGLAGGIDLWFLLGLLVPAMLAFGNIYRTVAWPRGEPPLPLAAGMLLAGGLAAAPVALLAGALTPDPAALTGAAPLIAAQVALYAAGYVLLYEVQRIAGPVFLSQLGYVIPPVGLLWGIGAFGEVLSLLSWAGLGLIAAGLVLVNMRRR